MEPLINGTAYVWSQIKCNILGVVIAGISKIEYDDKQEMQDNFGAGNRPVSRGYGKIECSAKMTLEMAEVEALQQAAVDGRLQSIPEFDVVVAYLPLGGVVVTHTLHNCRFKTNARSASTGDMAINVDLELLCSHISWK
jgi:hypothetical protein